MKNVLHTYVVRDVCMTSENGPSQFMYERDFNAIGMTCYHGILRVSNTTLLEEAIKSSKLDEQVVRDLNRGVLAFNGDQDVFHLEELEALARSRIPCRDIFETIVPKRWVFTYDVRLGAACPRKRGTMRFVKHLMKHLRKVLGFRPHIEMQVSLDKDFQGARVTHATDYYQVHESLRCHLEKHIPFGMVNTIDIISHISSRNEEWVHKLENKHPKIVASTAQFMSCGRAFKAGHDAMVKKSRLDGYPCPHFFGLLELSMFLKCMIVNFGHTRPRESAFVASMIRIDLNQSMGTERKRFKQAVQVYQGAQKSKSLENVWNGSPAIAGLLAAY